MRNPLESEEAAFRLVLGAIVYLALIVLGAWIATWLGVAVFVAVTAVAFALLRRGTKPLPGVQSSDRAAVEDTRRILVVTDETIGGPRLRAAIARLADGVAEDVLVMCVVASSPALPGGDETVEADAQERLETALQELRAAGVNARGTVALGAPLAALKNALERFAADEILIATTPGDRTAGSEGGIGDTARSLFDGPVTSVAEDGAS